MPPQKPALSDPARAALAWRRYRRLTGGMVIVAIIAVLAAILYLRKGGGPLPIHMLIATVAGVGLSVLLAAALMGLVFLSAGLRQDEDINREGDMH